MTSEKQWVSKKNVYTYGHVQRDYMMYYATNTMIDVRNSWII